MDNGTLTLAGTTGLFDVTGDGTAAVSFTGAAADVNTALDGLVYLNDTDYNGTDTLTITVSDQGNTGVDPGDTGDGTYEGDEDTVGITIHPVNDMPFFSYGSVPPDTVYWVADGTLYSGQSDGTGTVSATAFSSAGCYGMALDAFNRRLYWVEQGRVNRCLFDGTEYETVVEDGFTNVADIELDVAGDAVYWSALAAGTIMTSALDGTGAADFLTGASQVTGLGIDPGRGFLFFSSLGGTSSIKRVDLDGTGLTTVAAAAGSNVLGLACASGEERLYFGTAAGDVKRIGYDGTSLETLCGIDGEVWDVAVDEEGGQLYFGSRSAGKLYRADLDGGNLEEIVTGSGQIGGVVFEPGIPVDSADEDSGPRTVSGWITGIDPGAYNETAQQVTFHTANNHQALFAVQPSVSADGTLLYTAVNDIFGAAVVEVHCSDDGGTDRGGVDTGPVSRFTIMVDTVNDPPEVAVNTGTAVAEGGTVVITTAMLDEDDIDDDGADVIYTVVTASASGVLKLDLDELASTSTFTQADIDNSLVSYTHDGSETSADEFTFTIADDDGGADPGLHTFEITVTPVNDAPTVAAGGTLDIAGGAAAAAIDTGIILSDVDSSDLVSATVTVSRNFVPGEDVLAMGAPGGLDASYDASSGVLTVTGTASLADYQAALRSVTYLNIIVDDPTVYPRTVTVTVNDGGLSGSATSTVYVNDVTAPRIVSMDAEDSDGNGHLDLVSLTFSETLNTSGADIGDWLLLDADGVTDLLEGLDDTAVSIDGAVVTFTLADTTGTAGDPIYEYRENGVGGTLKDPSRNPLLDIVSPANHAPVADAGENQQTEPVLVWLDGSSSADADNHPFSYEWTQTAGPVDVGISGADEVLLSFPGRAAGTYDFTLAVEDPFRAGSQDSVSVTVLNKAPTAAAGRSRSVVKDTDDDLDVVLNGAASRDANSYTDPVDGSWRSDIESYAWEQVDGPVNIELADADTVAAAFDSFPVPGGRYTFRLTVTDRQQESDTADITITVFDPYANTVPTADAGRDITVYTHTNVTLTGHESKDSDGDSLTYRWEWVSGAAAVDLYNDDTVQPIFYPTAAGVYTFSLTVNDGTEDSLPDQVTVLAVEQQQEYPVAEIAVLGTVLDRWQGAVGEEIILEGNALGVDDPAAVSYTWTQLQGTDVLIPDETVRDLTVSPVDGGIYRFRLDVSKNGGKGDPAEIYLTVIADTVVDDPGQQPVDVNVYPPTADAGADLLDEEIGRLVTLDGTGSGDQDGDAITYIWTQVKGPTVILYDADTAQPTFTPTVVAAYRFQLVTFDGTYESLPDVVGVQAHSEDQHVPTAVIVEEEVAAEVGKPVTISGYKSYDPDTSDTLNYRWVQAAGPKVVLENPISPFLSFTPSYPGTYVFELFVDDGRPESLGDQVEIQVGEADPNAPEPVISGETGSGCFIATAAYGTPLAVEIGSLSRFRDRYLLPCFAGRRLVRLYYRYSPPAAVAISGSEPSRRMVRHILNPVVRGIELLLAP